MAAQEIHRAVTGSRSVRRVGMLHGRPFTDLLRAEDHMHDIKEQDAAFVYEAAAFSPGTIPPLLLAGIDEDDLTEPNVVRGID